MSEPTWSLAQMREMLALAEQLRFYDDVEHWKQRIAQAESEEGR